MAQVFKSADDKFDNMHDRFYEIKEGYMKYSESLHLLRSFAWTITSYCSTEKITIDAIDFHAIEEMTEFIHERKYLNYQEDSNCEGICNGKDVNLLYIPDGVTEHDKVLIADDQFTFGKLEKLRHDLIILFPAIKTIWYHLLNTPEDKDILTADILYVWCALAKAAKMPFFLIKGPDDFFIEQDDQHDYEAEWKRERQLQEAEEEKKWLEKYDAYIEKFPLIEFPGRKFVLNGLGWNSDELYREIIAIMVERHALERKAVSGATDYLVCNPKYAGESKINEAIVQQMKGKKVKIILMQDFLSAIGIETDADQDAENTAEAAQSEQQKYISKVNNFVPIQHNERMIPAKQHCAAEAFENIEANGLNVVSGQREFISAYASETLEIVLSYDTETVPCEIDCFVFLLSSAGTVYSEDDLYFYNHPGNIAESILVSKAAPIASVKLNQVKAQYHEVKICFALYEQENGMTLSDLHRITVRVICQGKELYNMTCMNISQVKSLEALSFYRNGHDWEVKFIGMGYKDTLDKLCSEHGVETL